MALVGIRELSEEEKDLCTKVVAQWEFQGDLKYKRIPNFITVITVLILACVCATGAIIFITIDHTALNSKLEKESLSTLGFMFLTLSLSFLGYILKELGRLRRGNTIALTSSAFIEYKTGIFGGKGQITIPWDQLEVSEKTLGTDILFIVSLLFMPGRKLVIRNKSTKKTLSYRSVTIRRYKELRAALITRVGLFEMEEVWTHKSRRITETEKALCAKVMAQWMTQGKLAFPRVPNLFTLLMIIVIGIPFVVSFIKFSPLALLSLDSDIVSLQWPYDVPARISLEKKETNGIKLSLVSGQFFDAKSKTIKLRAEILPDMSLIELARSYGGMSLSVPISGTYYTSIKKGYVVGPLLESLTIQPLEPKQSKGEAQIRQSAREMLRVLETLQDEAGILDLTQLRQNDIGILIANGFLIEKEIMSAPHKFSAVVKIPTITAPIFKIWYFFSLFDIVIFFIVYFLFKELWKLLPGNTIILTQSAFNEYRRGIFRARLPITVIWDCVEASECTYSGSGIKKLVPSLVITDKSTNRKYEYHSFMVKRYDELKAALIARVGLTKEHTVVHYEDNEGEYVLLQWSANKT